MRSWTLIFGVVVLAGCGGGGATLPPCDADGDCAAGSFCRPGAGCDFECRVDVDCAALGGGSCDTSRGRCSGTNAPDGGLRDGGIELPDGSTSPGDCRACEDTADCGSEPCIAYEGSDTGWCSRACTSDADCTALPGFTLCIGGYCVHDTISTECSTDGASTLYTDRCRRPLAAERCEPGDRCTAVGGGEHGCRGPSPRAMCARCTRDAECASGSCIFYEGFPESGFCTTSCASGADCAAYPGLTDCTEGLCAHTGFEYRCTGTSTFELRDSCGLVFTADACEGTDRCAVSAAGEVSCIATNRPACSPCDADVDCVGGACVGYEDAPDSFWCTSRCATNADCAAMPHGLTTCTSTGLCVAASTVTDCSADGTQVLQRDTCGVARPSVPCTSPQRCVIDASGSASCALPGSCTGTPSSCSGRSDSSSCRAVSGCSWASRCTGSAASCYTFYGSASCRAQDGCDYEGLYPRGSCRGSATSCRSISGEYSCDRQVGCSWDAACGGTPLSCGSFGDPTRCAAQPGCRWL